MPISLTSQWFLLPGCEEAALGALRQLAADVEAQEPGTLTYLVHTPYIGPNLQSLPPAAPSVLFYETYQDEAAFVAHVTGPLFTNFVAQHGSLFVQSHGKPFTVTLFLSLQAGFVRNSLE